MSLNSQEIIQQIMSKVEQAIQLYGSEKALNQTAYQAEKNIWKQMLDIGALFLHLYFEQWVQVLRTKSARNEEGLELAYHSHKSRQYLSLFGEISIRRPYYYGAGEGGYSPLEKATNMPEGKYSDLVREMFCALVVHLPYEKARHLTERYLGLNLSQRAIQEILAEESTEVEAYYSQKEVPALEGEETILVAQADGKGVPLVKATASAQDIRAKRGQARSQKKEAVVTALYATTPRHRTPEEVVASLFRQSTQEVEPRSKEHHPAAKMVWVTLAGKAVALTHLQNEVQQRVEAWGIPQCQRVALTDGDHALQRHTQEQLPDFTLVLDFIHSYEYLWKAANSYFGETHPDRLAWVKELTMKLLSGHLDALLETLDQAAQTHSPATQLKIEQIRAYFERNRPYLIYDKCLALGWPIASGVIEGACRHVVKDRMELSGMRWAQESAQELLNLRCIDENGCWDEYFEYSRQRRYAALPLAC